MAIYLLLLYDDFECLATDVPLNKSPKEELFCGWARRTIKKAFNSLYLALDGLVSLVEDGLKEEPSADIGNYQGPCQAPTSRMWF